MRSLSAWLVAFAAFVPLVLLAESSNLAIQLLLGASTAVMLALFVRSQRLAIAPIVTAIVIASIGEVILSIGCGLYSYRDAVIPLYVPFGHGVFYALAAATAARPRIAEIASRLTPAFVALVSVYSAVNLWMQNDSLGVLWWIIAALLLWRSHARAVLVVCCVFTMGLEFLGTALGSWQWTAVVPHLGLRAANPPSGVGVLYIVLDALTLAVVRRFSVSSSRTVAAALLLPYSQHAEAHSTSHPSPRHAGSGAGRRTHGHGHGQNRVRHVAHRFARRITRRLSHQPQRLAASVERADERRISAGFDRAR